MKHWRKYWNLMQKNLLKCWFLAAKHVELEVCECINLLCIQSAFDICMYPKHTCTVDVYLCTVYIPLRNKSIVYMYSGQSLTISTNRMIKQGKNPQKPQKSPGLPTKALDQNIDPNLTGIIKLPIITFSTKFSWTLKYLSNFSPKKVPETKILNPPKSFHYPSHLKFSYLYRQIFLWSCYFYCACVSNFDLFCVCVTEVSITPSTLWGGQGLLGMSMSSFLQ